LSLLIGCAISAFARTTNEIHVYVRDILSRELKIKIPGGHQAQGESTGSLRIICQNLHEIKCASILPNKNSNIAEVNNLRIRYRSESKEYPRCETLNEESEVDSEDDEGKMDSFSGLQETRTYKGTHL